MVRKVKNYGHLIEAKLANYLYGQPAKKMYTIGVTGTDGKTTTSSLIYHILRSAKLKAAMITTVGAQILDKQYETGLHTTTPSSFALQKYISLAAAAGCEYLVLEVTSHALDQNRIYGIDFKIGVLTNVTHEHLDYHKTYEKYVAAKGKLFEKSEISILNRDDESFTFIKKHVKNKYLTYSLKKTADFTQKNTKLIVGSGFDFNSYNFLASAAVAKTIGIDEVVIERALSTFKFPSGRQEIVYDRDFKVVIDFAHTPNSFDKVLPVLKKAGEGRLIHVFGSAGNRDKSKRPLMGKISSKTADIIILTAEDPRSEKIQEINNQIRLGMDSRFTSADYKLYSDGKNEKRICFEIPDRREAIEFAVKLARHGDTVLITGKGHEKSINNGHGEEPWSEHKAVENAFKKRLNG